MLPKSGGNFKEKAFRRSKFLDGTYEVINCPGQGEGAGWGTDSYNPPTDWPKKGYLLRMPQVVWLSVFVPDKINDTVPIVIDMQPVLMTTLSLTTLTYWSTAVNTDLLNPVTPVHHNQTTTIDYWFYSDGSYKVNEIDDFSKFDGGADSTPITLIPVTYVDGPLAQLQSFFVDHGTGKPDTHWYNHEIPNDYKTIHDNFINTVFPAVKSGIESIRSGKTWVEIIEDGQLNAPPPELNPYPMGPNFLHICVGAPQFMDDGTIDSLVASVSAAGMKWEGYKGFLYSITSSWDSFPNTPTIPWVETPPGFPTGTNMQRTAFGSTNMTGTNENVTTAIATEFWLDVDRSLANTGLCGSFGTGGLSNPNPPFLLSVSTDQTPEGGLLGYKTTPRNFDPADMSIDHTHIHNALDYYNSIKNAILSISDVQPPTWTDPSTTTDPAVATSMMLLASRFTDKQYVEYKGDGTNITADDLIGLIRDYFKFDSEGKDLAH